MPVVKVKRHTTRRKNGAAPASAWDFIPARFAGRVRVKTAPKLVTITSYNLDALEAYALRDAFLGAGYDARVVMPAHPAGETKIVVGMTAKAPAKRRKNGAKSVADPVAARELELYIENESALVAASNSMGRMIMRNLAGMMTRGTYDSTKAWKAWAPLADEGAKRYTREFGGNYATTFNKATREMVANRLAEAFESEVQRGAINLAALLAPRTNRR